MLTVTYKVQGPFCRHTWLS